MSILSAYVSVRLEFFIGWIRASKIFAIGFKVNTVVHISGTSALTGG